MNNKKIPVGVKMAINIAGSNNKDNSNVCEDNDLMQLKQLIVQINKILDNNIFMRTLDSNKEIHADLKELIKKSVDILA